MIIDLAKFIAAEQPFWTELDAVAAAAGERSGRTLPLHQSRRFHYLYERTAADLARLNTFANEPEIRRFLELLVARAYGEVHETRETPHRFQPWHWFTAIFPRTFRRHLGAFWLAVAITLAGAPSAGWRWRWTRRPSRCSCRLNICQMDPRERVAREENAKTDRLAGEKADFAAYLMTHNTQVSLLTMALGMTWGVGTILMLFYNGVMLGAVAVDYITHGGNPIPGRLAAAARVL